MDSYRLEGRQRQGLPCLQVEQASVLPALKGALLGVYLTLC